MSDLDVNVMFTMERMEKEMGGKKGSEKPEPDLNRGQNAAAKRRRLVDIEVLDSQLDNLRQCCTDLRTAIDVAREFKIDNVTVDGATKFDRSVVDLKLYILNVRTAISRITIGGVSDKISTKKR